MDKLCYLGESAAASHSEAAKIIILPVPYDQTSTWQKGADLGPQAILEASPHLEFFDIETGTEVYHQGIYTELPVETRTPEEMIEQVYQRTLMHLKSNRFAVAVGGEHSISIGSVKACAQINPKLSVLQLDAHADLRETYNGSKYNHACVMARIREFCPIVQVGIRSLDKSESESFDPQCMFFAQDIYDSAEWMDKAIAQLTEAVYVTIDLDVFDSGIMPSTGTPEPGGMNWYPVLSFLRKVSEQRTVIGFDVVELCPGSNKAPDFLAAKLIYKFLSYIWR